MLNREWFKQVVEWLMSRSVEQQLVPIKVESLSVERNLQRLREQRASSQYEFDRYDRFG